MRNTSAPILPEMLIGAFGCLISPTAVNDSGMLMAVYAFGNAISAVRDVDCVDDELQENKLVFVLQLLNVCD